MLQCHIVDTMLTLRLYNTPNLSLVRMRCLSREWNAIVNRWLVVNKVAMKCSQLHVSVKN